jgi:hypothetical protein
MSSPSVALREWLVVILGGITLGATAWLTGGVELYGLHSFWIGSVLTFLAAVLPMPTKWNGSDGLHGNKQNIVRLLCFPFFWISLLFLTYITIQAFNPAWEQVYRDNGRWYVTTQTHVHWLPSSVESFYGLMNPFRVLVSFSAAFMLMWAIWVGVQRRRSLLALMWIFVLSGTGMAIVALLQDFTGATKVFWLVPSANKEFWGSFFYGNQGAAYLILTMTGCSALYFYYWKRCERRGQSGGPYLLLFFLLGVVYFSVCMAMSRGGILFGSLFMAGFLVCTCLRWMFAREANLPLKARLLVATVILAGCGFVWSMVDVTGLEAEWKKMESQLQDLEQDSRYLVSKITWEMSQKNMVLGAGAGSWMYIFPLYQMSHPSIFYSRYRPAEPDHPKKWRREGIAKGRKFYYYAHNDILQFFYEFGIVGCSILLLGYVTLLGTMAWHSGAHAFSGLMLLIGLVAVCGHAFADFLFQAPAYWIALNALILLVVKLLVMEGKRSRRID